MTKLPIFEYFSYSFNEKYQTCVLVFDSYAYQNKTSTLISEFQKRILIGLAAVKGKLLKKQLNLL